MQPKISLQLWSLKEECEKDLLGTLEKVKALGYDGVEFFDYFNHSATEIRNKLNELDLAVSGAHLNYEKLKDDFAETVAFQQAIGNQQLIIPYLAGENFSEWLVYFEEIAKLLEKVKAAKLSLSYHNHAHELTAIPGRDILAEMLKELPALSLEIDTFWLAYAGINELDWLNKYQKNIKHLHLKDMIIREQAKESTEIGNGTLPIKSYLKFAKTADLPWIVIEQEAFQAHQPLASAAINLKQTRKLIKEVYEND